MHIIAKHVCCGRPLYDFGLLDSARTYLNTALTSLEPYLAQDTPIVMLEPSCATVFRDEATNLLPNDPRAHKVRANTYLLSEFLVKKAPHYTPPQRTGSFVVQGHCHHQAVMKMTDELTLLRATGAEVTLLDSGCCGMAGPFGFERDKFDISQTLAERRPPARRPRRLTHHHPRRRRLQLPRTNFPKLPRRGLHLAEVLAED